MKLTDPASILLLSIFLASPTTSQSTTSQSTSNSLSSSSSSSSSASSSSSSQTSSNANDDGYTFSSGLSVSTITTGSASIPSGSYQSYTTQSSVSSSSRNATTSNSLLLTGGASSTTSNSTRTSTSSSPTATNTQPCNNYPELCDRRYMNFTEVCAHNSAFAIANNAASNQNILITGQLDDGIRMIQGETHYVNDTIYSCHTSCSLLNAGPLVDELHTVATWVQSHPYDVVTILLVNSDFRPVSDYIPSIQNSGLAPYLYEPPKIPMYADDWPTIGQMILTGKRVVVFMDYNANQTAVPYILDEFSQIWETPFSPTNDSFPCTQQRPPNLSKADARNELPMLANHNLNIRVAIGGSDTLIPQFDALNQTNSVNGTQGMGSKGSLGAMADQCMEMWGKPPAWLLVDFYETGNFPGSVFEVAARMNNLTYQQGDCCAATVGSGGVRVRVRWGVVFGTAVMSLVVMVGSGLW